MDPGSAAKALGHCDFLLAKGRAVIGGARPGFVRVVTEVKLNKFFFAGPDSG